MTRTLLVLALPLLLSTACGEPTDDTDGTPSTDETGATSDDDTDDTDPKSKGGTDLYLNDTDFEAKRAKGELMSAYWTPLVMQGFDGEARVVDEGVKVGAYSGTYYLDIFSQGNRQGVMQILQGDALHDEYEMFFSYSSLCAGLEVVLLATDPGTGTQSTHHTANLDTPANGWATDAVTFDAPEGDAYLTLEIAATSDGSDCHVYVDDIGLQNVK